MSAIQEIVAIEAAAKRADLAMGEILRDAGVNPSTWWRWKRGKVDPGLSLFRRVEAALAARLNNHSEAA